MLARLLGTHVSAAGVYMQGGGGLTKDTAAPCSPSFQMEAVPTSPGARRLSPPCVALVLELGASEPFGA